MRRSDGGTLFLDEVGETPPPVQVKLLRALRTARYAPVGARKPVNFDVRIVTATNRNLNAEVKAGRFREDLFDRLHVYPLMSRRCVSAPKTSPILLAIS